MKKQNRVDLSKIALALTICAIIAGLFVPDVLLGLQKRALYSINGSIQTKDVMLYGDDDTNVYRRLQQLWKDKTLLNPGNMLERDPVGVEITRSQSIDAFSGFWFSAIEAGGLDWEAFGIEYPTASTFLCNKDTPAISCWNIEFTDNSGNVLTVLMDGITGFPLEISLIYAYDEQSFTNLDGKLLWDGCLYAYKDIYGVELEGVEDGSQNDVQAVSDGALEDFCCYAVGDKISRNLQCSQTNARYGKDKIYYWKLFFCEI